MAAAPSRDAEQQAWRADRRPPARRAPRLAPDEYIAPYITRLGRFRELDPSKARKLPRFTKVAGVIAWGVFVVETFRRARRAERAGAVTDD